MLELISFSFVYRYLTAKITLEFKWSVIFVLDSVSYSWETGAVHSTAADEKVRGENYRDISVVHEKEVVLALPGRFTRADTEVMYCYH